jgi:hypothetical protein
MQTRATFPELSDNRQGTAKPTKAPKPPKAKHPTMKRTDCATGKRW